MDSANLYNVHQQNPHVILPLQFPSCLASSHDPSWDHNFLLNHGCQENSVQGVQMFNRDPSTELDLNSINMVEHHVSVAPFSSKNHPGLELNTWGNHSDNHSDYPRINEELELDSARNFHGLQIPSADQLFPHPAISSNYLVSPQASDGATLSAQRSPVANFCYEETIASVNGNPHEMEYLRRLNPSYSPLEITTQINSYQNKRSGFVNEASAKNRTNGIPQSKGIQRACKRQRLDTSNPIPPLKVRKEKLSDKISELQQLVSPFGKTDTASVLKEAIGYIHFLHNQVETLSVPNYLKPSSTHTSTIRMMHGVDPYETCSTLQYRAAEEKKEEGHFKDLRSRRLCLVPTSMMSHLSNDNVAALWPRPSFGPP